MVYGGAMLFQVARSRVLMPFSTVARASVSARWSGVVAEPNSRASEPSFKPAQDKLYGAYVEHGKQLLTEGNLIESVAEFQSALGVDPGRGEARDLLVSPACFLSIDFRCQEVVCVSAYFVGENDDACGRLVLDTTSTACFLGKSLE